MIRLLRLAAAAATLAVVLTGCGYDDTPLPPEPEAESPTTATSTTCTTNPSDLESYEPSDEVPSGGALERIRGDKLVVGVSADTYLMASANPKKGNRIEGFDIEFVKAIGRAIYGDDFNLARDIQFRVITAANRIPLLTDGSVDIVARNFTINSCRWEEIDFSAEYYHATQKVLVSSELDDDVEENGEYRTPEDLAGLRVCAPKGSTSLDNITNEEPDAIIEPADTHTGCLVKFQRGEVDAITGDDTVLAGLAAQDPYAVVPEDQTPLHDEPYGIGVQKGERDLVAFINDVISDMVELGVWDRAYRDWLQPVLGKCTSDCPPGSQGVPPTPLYGRS